MEMRVSVSSFHKGVDHEPSVPPGLGLAHVPRGAQQEATPLEWRGWYPGWRTQQYPGNGGKTLADWWTIQGYKRSCQWS